jgi:hypothetical protein
MKRRNLALALATTVWALVAAAGAQATTITVGSVLPITFSTQPFGQVETQFNTTLPEKGANLTSPVDGTIVRWRMQGAEGGPYFLRVLHPNGKGAYVASGSSGAATPTGPGLQTFTANITIHSGDLIGIDPTHTTDGIGVATVAGAGYSYIFPPPFDGATVAPSGSETGKELELSAEVQPAPSITSVEPKTGSVVGGETVTIKGENLTGASGVKFGTVPAASFTVASDTEITATTPRSSLVHTVDVTATTLAGTSEAGRRDRFTYEGCVVPRLKGKTLAASRTALRRANCRLGKVTGKLGKVARQTPAAGRVLAPGARVKVKLKQAR